MPARRETLLGGLALALGLAGPPAAGAVEPNRSNLHDLPEIRLDVAEVESISVYAPPRAEPNIEHRLAFPPHVAIAAWAKSHLRPVGRRFRATLSVLDASVARRKVKPETASFRDWFRRQPDERYDGRIELRLDIKDDAGQVRATATAVARHSRFLMDDHKDGDRDRHLEALSDELTAAALRELARQVETRFGPWRR
jgi:hypothetical protein